MKDASILIVDDDPDVLTAVRLLLKTEVRQVVTEKSPENLKWLLSQQPFDLILLDMNFNSSINTGNEGFFWLKKIREYKSEAMVIMITAYGDIDLAVRSLKEGAADFVVKPWHNERLVESLKEGLKRKGNKQSPVPVFGADSIIGSELLGSSKVMEDVFFKIEKIAPTDANILILGENGTGKDLVARAIHQHSNRSSKPFVKVDLGALTESLFESELFGHKKGSFTDAREDRVGRFEAAHGGTVFLDEIGNISLQQQAKLLSVLQNRQVIRLGTNEPIPIDIRLICATNLPLSELSDESCFRKDLIYRINTVDIMLPPLRKRKSDIMMLARHFAKLYSNKYLKSGLEFDASAEQKLLEYHYPGNIRELRNVVESLTILSDKKITTKDVETYIIMK